MNRASPRQQASAESAATLWLAGVLLAVLAGLAYLPALRGGFIWDDDTLLTQNPLIKAADGLRRFWFTTEAPDYWPVTSTAFWLEWRLWGMHAAGYHATNLVLHIAESLLLWRILRQIRLPGAFLAALLFAVHPVNVESVAWIAQLKNLMAMLFFLLSIRWFLEWLDLEAPRRSRHYWLSLAACGLALLSKGSVAPLPLVLVGIVAWRRRLTATDWVRLAPFFLSAGVMAAVNIWFQSHGTAVVIRSAGPIERLLGGATVVWFYLAKALWPAALSFVYPEWHIRPSDSRWWLPLLALIAATCGLGRWARRRPEGRAALFGWGYFCAMLIPVLGLTDVYFMKYSLVADHYEHLALIGVVSLAAAGFTRIWAATRGVARTALPVAASAVVFTLALLTWRQCGIYRDDRTLFTATLARNPNCWMAHGNLAVSLNQAGQVDAAIAEYDVALQIKPDYPEALNNLGVILAGIPGRMSEALAHFETVLRINPNYAEAQYNLANTLARIPGRMPEALTHYQAALRINPRYAKAQDNLANALATIPGRMPEALDHFGQALQIDPGFAHAHYDLANALASVPGRTAEAVEHYLAALRIQPDFAGAEYNLAVLYATTGRIEAAAAHFERAFKFDPALTEARDNASKLRALTNDRRPTP